jgi:Flp pilus assembly pilin Flp
MILAYIRARLGREEGQALVEYALIISLIAITLIGALGFVSGKLDGIFTVIGSAL